MRRYANSIVISILQVRGTESNYRYWFSDKLLLTNFSQKVIILCSFLGIPWSSSRRRFSMTILFARICCRWNHMDSFKFKYSYDRRNEFGKYSELVDSSLAMETSILEFPLRCIVPCGHASALITSYAANSISLRRGC